MTKARQNIQKAICLASCAVTREDFTTASQAITDAINELTEAQTEWSEYVMLP